jgi:hypothetical protein
MKKREEKKPRKAIESLNIVEEAIQCMVERHVRTNFNKA